MGWMRAVETPVACRLAGSGQTVDVAIPTLTRTPRPDVAVTLGLDGEDQPLGFLIALPVALLWTVPLLDRALAIELVDAGGAVLLRQDLAIPALALGGGGFDGELRGVIEFAIASGVYPPEVAAALRWLDRAGEAEAPREGHVDHGARIGDGLLLTGWIINGAERDLLMLTGNAEAVSHAADLVFFERADAGGTIRGWGRALTTDRHGFVTTFPIVAASTDSIHVFERHGADMRYLTTVTWAGGDAEPAMATFMKYVGQGRFPSPERARHHLRPLLGRSPAIASGHDRVVLRAASEPVTLSVVVPLFGRPFLLRSLLRNQRAYPAGTEFVYVGDDPGQHGFFASYLADRASLIAHPTTLLLNHANDGYALANNKGAAEAAGELLLFQNSDVWIEDPAALTLAIEAIRADRHAIIGFRLLYEDGTLQHDGMRFDRGGFVHGMYVAEHPGKGLPPAEAGPIDAVAAVTGAMMMMRRNWFESLGGFDPAYVRGDFEDADLCLRSVEAGGGVGLVRSGSIRHLERQSIAQAGGAAMRSAVTYLNCIRFNDRWGARLDAAG